MIKEGPMTLSDLKEAVDRAYSQAGVIDRNTPIQVFCQEKTFNAVNVHWGAFSKSVSIEIVKAVEERR